MNSTSLWHGLYQENKHHLLQVEKANFVFLKVSNVFTELPLCGSAGKKPTCGGRDLGSIPGLGRSPGEGKGYPVQYSGLENSTDCVGHEVYLLIFSCAGSSLLCGLFSS